MLPKERSTRRLGIGVQNWIHEQLPSQVFGMAASSTAAQCSFGISWFLWEQLYRVSIFFASIHHLLRAQSFLQPSGQGLSWELFHWLFFLRFVWFWPFCVLVINCLSNFLYVLFYISRVFKSEGIRFLWYLDMYWRRLVILSRVAIIMSELDQSEGVI